MGSSCIGFDDHRFLSVYNSETLLVVFRINELVEE